MTGVDLCVSIDTEEDNWGPTQAVPSAENIRALPALAMFFEGLGIRPTYFVTYQVTIRRWAAEILAEISAGGRGEIGAHLHPWNTPPIDPVVRPGDSMLCNLAEETQRAKLAVLTEAMEQAFGRRPLAFRAGRFGFGPGTARALIAAGYPVDSSVTPNFSWQRSDAGPNFLGAPLGAYTLDGKGDVREPVPGGSLVEVPISAGFTGFRVRQWGKLLTLSPSRRALLARTGLARRSMLSPETTSARDMLAVARRILDAGIPFLHVMFHSSSLRPGLSEFTHSRRDVLVLYDRIEQFLEGLRRDHSVRSWGVGEYGLTHMPADHPAHVPSAGDPARVSSVSYPKARLRAPRVLIINYHFPPDPSAGGLRWGGFSKYLVRLGWDVHVLTASSQAHAGLDAGVHVHVCPRARTLNDVYQASAARVRGGQVPSVPEAAGGRRHGIRAELGALLAFPDDSRGWGFRATRRARTLIRQYVPDVVITSGPPHSAHLVGLWASWGIPLQRVVDLRDPWSGQSRPWRDDPVSGARFAKRLIPWLERLTFAGADLILANTEELAEQVRARYPKSAVQWLRNGVDFERIAAGAPVERFPGLSITYAGTLYGGRDLEPALEAFRRFLERHPDAARAGSKLRVVGERDDPPVADRFTRLVHERGMEPVVEFHPVVTAERALELSRRSAILIVLAQNQELQVPGKLYELSGLGTPFFVLTERGSATDREARRLGALVIEPGDIDGIVSLLEDVSSGRRLETPVPRHLIDYESLVEQLDRALRRATQG